MTMQKNKGKALWDVFALPARLAPVPAVLLIGLSVSTGVIPTLQALATASFIDSTLSYMAGGASAHPLAALALLVVLVALDRLLAKASDFVGTALDYRLKLSLRQQMMDKRAGMSYAHIENAKTWDLIARVCESPEQKVGAGIRTASMLLAIFIRIGGLIVLIAAEVWWAAAIVLVLAIPLLWAAIRGGKDNYRGTQETTKLRRQYEYLSELLVSREAAQERTLFGYTEAMDQHFYAFFETVRKKMLRIDFRSDVRSAMSGIIAAAAMVAVSLLLLGPAMAGALTVGMFIALVNAVFTMQSLLTEQLHGLAQALTENHAYMEEYRAFEALSMEASGDKGAMPAPAFASLAFQNVRFRYPDTDQYILDGLSFTIRAGGHYAFVGANGAGKTTVTKLMTALFDGYEGVILLNGQDLRTMPPSQVRAFFAAVFQDFAHYGISLRENIAVGREALDWQTALAQAGLTPLAEDLPQGVDTPLGKVMPDGQDVSGGQWQRIAMARCIASPAPIRILDEPTAALDPIAESEVYSRYAGISAGKTTIFISHRLGSTKLASHIFVMDRGRIVQEGSHAALMAEGGLYAAMYESQRGWYQ